MAPSVKRARWLVSAGQTVSSEPPGALCRGGRPLLVLGRARRLPHPGRAAGVDRSQAGETPAGLVVVMPR